MATEYLFKRYQKRKDILFLKNITCEKKLKKYLYCFAVATCIVGGGRGMDVKISSYSEVGLSIVATNLYSCGL